MEPRRLTGSERDAWDREFQRLCERFDIAAAYYVPVVTVVDGRPMVGSSCTGGERRVCDLLDRLVRQGSAHYAEWGETLTLG